MKKSSNLFKLRGELTSRQGLVLAILGLLITLGIWTALTTGSNPVFNSAQFPSPGRVWKGLGDLCRDNNLFKNMFFSIGMNVAGYVEAILLSIPLGFLIGLSPIFKGLFTRQVEAFRYTALAAIIPVFVTIFGINTSMKVHFLAFGIMIYLMPVVVQRIREVEDVYLKTTYTLGANAWQTILTVYLPSVVSRLSDDIRVLTAISWTYIIFAENMGNEGGLGGLIWSAGLRQARMDKVIAIVLIIMLFGVIQDKVFEWLDRKYFPHKYEAKSSEREKMGQRQSIGSVILDFVVDALVWMGMVLYLVLALNEVIPIISSESLLGELFGWSVWVVHLIMLIVISIRVRDLITRFRTSSSIQKT